MHLLMEIEPLAQHAARVSYASVGLRKLGYQEGDIAAVARVVALDAAKKFRPERGFPLERWMAWKISKGLLTHLRSEIKLKNRTKRVDLENCVKSYILETPSVDLLEGLTSAFLLFRDACERMVVK